MAKDVSKMEVEPNRCLSTGQVVPPKSIHLLKLHILMSVLLNEVRLVTCGHCQVNLS